MASVEAAGQPPLVTAVAAVAVATTAAAEDLMAPAFLAIHGILAQGAAVAPPSFRALKRTPAPLAFSVAVSPVLQVLYSHPGTAQMAPWNFCAARCRAPCARQAITRRLPAKRYVFRARNQRTAQSMRR